MTHLGISGEKTVYNAAPEEKNMTDINWLKVTFCVWYHAGCLFSLGDTF